MVVSWSSHQNRKSITSCFSQSIGLSLACRSDTEMELAEEARELIEAVKPLTICDEDGIFCIPSVNAEQAGAERLRDYLQQVLLANGTTKPLPNSCKKGAKSTNLEAWLRDEFLCSIARCFQNRPSSGTSGMAAKMDFRYWSTTTNTKDNLSKLIYTYLGDWIRMCEAKKKAGESGAEGLLSAAQNSKRNWKPSWRGSSL